MALGLIGVTALAVCWKGRHIDGVYETYKTNHHADSLLEGIETCFKDAEIPVGARLAYIDAYQFSKAHSVYLPFLLTNTPSLLQRATTHLYEPLESDTHAEGHLNMDSFHGLNRPTLAHRKHTMPTTDEIRNIGATHLFAKTPELLDPKTRTLCTDPQGLPLYFQKIPNAFEDPFPQLLNASSTDTITQEPSGLLKVTTSSTKEPQVNSVIPIRWEKTPTGWIGYPNPIHPLFGVSVVLLLLLMVFIFWRVSSKPPAAQSP